jgi:hypothetical protein
MTETKYKSGDTFLTECGNGRTTYKPEWSPSKPWSVYVRGTATNSFPTLEYVRYYFKARHNMRLL